MRPAASLLALLLLSAPSQAMVGNAPEAGADEGARHAVLIVSSRGSSCTGTAIARDLVLTADVALLKLADAMPAQLVPARLSTAPAPTQTGGRFLVPGYGVTVRGDGRSGGTLRMAELTATGRPGNVQLRLVDPETQNAAPGLGACTGDSGAPVFHRNGAGLELIGIVSWSTAPNNAAGCGGLTGVTPLALYRSWIIEAAGKLGSRLAG
jgi:hypothetical protein